MLTKNDLQSINNLLLIQKKEILNEMDKKLTEQNREMDKKLTEQNREMDKKLTEQNRELDKKLTEQNRELDKKLTEQNREILKGIAIYIQEELVPLLDENEHRLKHLEKHTDHPPVAL